MLDYAERLTNNPGSSKHGFGLRSFTRLVPLACICACPPERRTSIHGAWGDDRATEIVANGLIGHRFRFAIARKE
jgi:hypothetical protein